MGLSDGRASLLAMEATGWEPGWVEAGRVAEASRKELVAEMAQLAAHVNAAVARWLGLVLECRRQGVAAGDDFAVYLGWRCGIAPREAREFLRVGEALEALPLIGAAFERGELSWCKVRQLTRVATAASEEGLLSLAAGLTASQLERALRAFRRVQTSEAAESHRLEYVDWFWDEDGSLLLRARLAAEDGVVVVRALEAAAERVRAGQPQDWRERLRKQQESMTPPRPAAVEALVDLAGRSLTATGPEDEGSAEPVRLVVHVDAAALTADGPGRCELEQGPVISPETARRLGCDADQVASVERDGLPISVGRRRRTVPPRLRRLLEARDQGICRWPGCDRRRHLAAHHRRHWAHGGQTSLDNLVLLCFQHHRLVHEGGYTIESGRDGTGELRFRNRHGLLCPTVTRPPPGSHQQLIQQNTAAGITIDDWTNQTGDGYPIDLALTIDVIQELCIARE